MLRQGLYLVVLILLNGCVGTVKIAKENELNVLTKPTAVEDRENLSNN